MTIDERLEKLTERHEALTHTVELMAAENRAGFARLEKLSEEHEKLAKRHEKLAERLDRLTERHEALTQSVELMAAENRSGFARVEGIVGQMARSIDTLARVVELPEHPLDHLEGGAS
jgi:predicted nuclease with TOPRIM domain